MKVTSLFNAIVATVSITSLLLLCGCVKEEPVSAPELTTNSVIDISSTSARSGGVITDNGGADIIARGICWSTEEAPTINHFFSEDGSGDTSFMSNITGLSPVTTYFVRAYATNSAGTGYGNEVQFTTVTGLPIVTTLAVEEIEVNSAKSGGNITDEGDGVVIARGVCWNVMENPTISDFKTEDSDGDGNYVSHLTELTRNTTYYVRAYAQNEIGTAYGEEHQFTTQTELPVVSTSPIENIESFSANSGGTVSDDGGAEIASQGTCWSTEENPTLDDNFIVDDSGNNTFTLNLSELNPSTTYYVRAFATNKAGTSYGEEVSFTTLVAPPTVIIIDFEEIGSFTAIGGGNVTHDGGAEVIARGLCWSLTADATIDDNKTEDGVGTGVFSSNLTGLSPNRPYYVRAYATNSAGTAYSQQWLFHTEPALPKVETVNVDNVGATNLTIAGFVSCDGGVPLAEIGFCWSTSTNPTKDDNNVSMGPGTGNYSAEITGLTPETSYYLRAYARSQIGISYGEEIVVTTSTGHHYNGHTYTTKVLGELEWFVENLQTTTYNNGEPIPTDLSDAEWSEADYGAYGVYFHEWVFGLNSADEVRNTYGALYNWHAVNTGNLCPDGWRVPTREDWATLIDFAGGEDVAGGKLKSTRTIPNPHPRWQSINYQATDEFGFNAIPGGYRYLEGTYAMIEGQGIWWSSTEHLDIYGWGSSIHFNYANVNLTTFHREIGMSVRCVRDI